MPAESREAPIPTGDLAAPGRRTLDTAGYTTLEQLADVPEGAVGNLHGMGPSAMETLRQDLAAHGLSFGEVE